MRVSAERAVFPIMRTKVIGQRTCHADRLRWRGPFFCLLAAIVTLLSLGQPVSVQWVDLDLQYVADATYHDLDCDDAHAQSGHHCCAGTACSAHAQFEAAATPVKHVTGAHPLPVVEDVRVGLSLRPNLQPPQRSISA